LGNAPLRGLEGYWFELPNSLIAQEPCPERGGSRLLVLDRGTGGLTLASFGDLAAFLPPGALLVLNDARVSPARLFGTTGGGAKVEALILDPAGVPDAPGERDLWCLCRKAAKLSPGTRVTFRGAGDPLEASALAVGEGGRRLLRFSFSGPPSEALGRLGHAPLPPYIKRPATGRDLGRYQTVYARRPGAVAAPTAGLHFTEAHLDGLRAMGFGTAFVHLRVGAGTFLPLTKDSLAKGRLHEEWAEVGPDTAKAVNDAKAQGRAVVCVGTTSVRALEWAAGPSGAQEASGMTDIFIRPGHRFRAADALITNFHLPGSSLLMLVAAFAGLGRVLDAYAFAIREGLRFYSYGDAMLVL
jgi:S-adenosylmethionine:tRNA ribosyltransferase-isomerase